MNAQVSVRYFGLRHHAACDAKVGDQNGSAKSQIPFASGQPVRAEAQPHLPEGQRRHLRADGDRGGQALARRGFVVSVNGFFVSSFEILETKFPGYRRQFESRRDSGR